jgi:hypothetical protein
LYKGTQKFEYNKKLRIQTDAFVQTLVINKFDVNKTVEKFRKKSPNVVSLVVRYMSTGGNFAKDYFKSHRNNKALINKILNQRQIVK